MLDSLLQEKMYISLVCFEIIQTFIKHSYKQKITSGYCLVVTVCYPDIFVILTGTLVLYHSK